MHSIDGSPNGRAASDDSMILLRDQPRPSPLVVLIPAYNEERFIASVVITTLQFADHVVVIDDGSKDRTAMLAEAAGAHVVRQGSNRGKAQAVNAGFAVARSYSPRAVVCLDGDAQHEPSEIPRLVAPIVAGEADVVIGSRFMDVRSKIPRWRQFGQHGLTLVTNSLSGVRVSDSQSGYRAYSPTAVRTLRFLTDGLSLESEMQFLLQASGLRVTEVPISVKYLDGNKRNPVMHGLQVVDAVLKLVARRRPLLFISLPGTLVVLAGLALGIRVGAVYDASGALMLGSAVLTGLLILAGLLTAMTGIMLHSIGHFATSIRSDLKALVGEPPSARFAASGGGPARAAAGGRSDDVAG